MEPEFDDIRDLSRVPKHLQPYVYKKGQSGNPKGRPEGSSLKDYVKKKFRTMTDEEKEDFLEGIDKMKIWEMAEDKPKQATDITGEMTSKVISIDE